MAYDETYEPDDGPPAAEGQLVRVIDTATGEEKKILPFPHSANEVPLALRDSTFAKIATKPVLKKQDKILRADADPEAEIDILPSGEIYMSHVHVRRRLNEAFGPMGWALRPLAQPAIDPTTNVMYREWALVAGGRVVGTAFGSTKYQPKNKRMDFADAAEAVKSNALTRICKDLGIGSECWDRRWAEDWRNKYAVHVYVKVKQWNRNTRKEEWQTPQQWRRVDAQPFHGELEPVKDSPNQDKWRAQMGAWIALLDAEYEKSKEVVRRLRDAREKAKAASTETTNAVEETRAQTPPPQATTPKAPNLSSERAQSKPSTPVQHGNNGIKQEDRPFLIRECSIAKRDKSYILHRITMMDGSNWFTFSTTTYGEMQLHYARRDMIEITEWETHRLRGEQYKHITKWVILKHGVQAPLPDDRREPGQEG